MIVQDSLNTAFQNAYKTCVIWPISPKWPPGDLKLVTSISMPQIQKLSKNDIQKSNFRRRSSIWVQWKSIWIDTQRLRVKIDTYVLSAKWLKIIKNTLCFPLQMDSRVAVKLHLDDNWVSNGPHMALRKHCKTLGKSTHWPLSSIFQQNPCMISLKSEIVTKTVLRSVHFELLPPTFQ